MPIASHNGLKFHLQELGPTSGETVVMLHGLLIGSLATWYFTVAPVLARARHVVLYDLRGHGLSERAPAGYDVATMSADLESIVTTLAGPPVVLVGHSYGAAVALSYALARPDRVGKLVLVEAPLPPSNLDELTGFLDKTPEAMAEALPHALQDVLGRRGRHASRLIDTLRFLAFESSLLKDLREASDHDDGALARIRCPVLLVYGKNSSCRPVGKRLARVIPGARLVEIEAGHFLPIETPAALGACIAAFLDGGTGHG